jgi:PhzF family phenazine biosynthesis protein
MIISIIQSKDQYKTVYFNTENSSGIIKGYSMKIFQFKKIDAFATTISDGNPAGFIRLKSFSEITNSEMLQIAKELKGYVNEVGYVAQTSETSFSLKFFSSECEVDFCGHATIAIMYDLIKNDNKLRQFETVDILTNRGKLFVKNRLLNEDAVYIMSPIPHYTTINLEINNICKPLKIEPSSILQEEPISIINAGLTTLIIPIKSIDELLEISPDLEELKMFCIESNIDIIEVYTRNVIDINNNYRVRVFAPRFGYLEDPATGSGNSAFGYYLIQNNAFNREMITIEQNGNRNKFNIIKLRKEIDTENNIRVLFGGSAITRMDGNYILH